MRENWKDIPGVDGYQASDAGRIRSAFRILKTDRKVSNGGYLMFGIWQDNKGKTLNVHRCVALAWLEPVEGREHVNHKNGDRKDNRVENLEWVTRSENILHGLSRAGRYDNMRKVPLNPRYSGRSGSNNHLSRLTSESLTELRALLKRGDMSQTEIARKFGISKCGVSRIKLGQSYKD